MQGARYVLLIEFEVVISFINLITVNSQVTKIHQVLMGGVFALSKYNVFGYFDRPGHCVGSSPSFSLLS